MDTFGSQRGKENGVGGIISSKNIFFGNQTYPTRIVHGHEKCLQIISKIVYGQWKITSLLKMCAA